MTRRIELELVAAAVATVAVGEMKTADDSASASGLIATSPVTHGGEIVVMRSGMAETNRIALTKGMLCVSARQLGRVEWVELTLDCARAKVGERGYFVLPNGFYGEFTSPTNCEYVLGSAMMPMFGMKTPRKTFVGFVEGLPWSYKTIVRVKDGVYSVALRFMLDGRPAEEDIRVELQELPADAEYPQMATAYRNRRLARGEAKPIVERMKEQPDGTGTGPCLRI